MKTIRIRVGPALPWLLLSGCYGPLWGTPTGHPTGLGTSVPPPDSLPLESPEEGCISVLNATLVEQPPTALSVSLQVVRCGTCDGIEPLTYPPHFRVINDETGEPFDARDEGTVAFAGGPPIVVPAYTVIALDLSESIFAKNAVPLVFEAARTAVQQILATDPADVQHQVAFYVFGAPNRNQAPYAFTADPPTILAELAQLEADAENLGSTDLYQAHQDALQLVALQSAGVKLARRYLLVISDGTHEAGDLADQRARSLLLREQLLDDVDTWVASVPTGALDETRLCELADSVALCLDAENLEVVQAAFASVDQQLTWLQNSVYGFGICTPVALGSPSLTIEITAPGARPRSIQLDYQVNELDGSIQNCDPRDWVPQYLEVWPPK